MSKRRRQAEESEEEDDESEQESEIEPEPINREAEIRSNINVNGTGGLGQNELGTALNIIKRKKKKKKLDHHTDGIDKIRINNQIVKKFSIHSGKPIAHILKSNGKPSKDMIYLATDKEGEFPYVNCQYEMFPCFYKPDNQSLCIMISGKKGSGKSYMANKIIKEIITREKNKKVFVIARDDSDESIDSGIEHIIKHLQPEPYKIELLKDSIIVFDDITSIPDQTKAEYAQKVANECCEVGRKWHIDVIFINHKMRDHNKTKKVITEFDFIVVFPNTGNDAQISSFNKAYLGLNNETMYRLLNTNNSDWILISSAAPGYIMTQHELFVPTGKKNKYFR